MKTACDERGKNVDLRGICVEFARKVIRLLLEHEHEGYIKRRADRTVSCGPNNYRR